MKQDYVPVSTTEVMSATDSATAVVSNPNILPVNAMLHEPLQCSSSWHACLRALDLFADHSKRGLRKAA